MRVPYTPNRKLYDDYYTNQTGHGLPVYIGRMRGKGLGIVLSGLFRAAVPLLKRGVTSGLQVAQDVLSGQNLKSSVKKRVKGTGHRLLKRAFGGLKPPPGEPVKKCIKKHARYSKSKRGRDIFGQTWLFYITVRAKVFKQDWIYFLCGLHRRQSKMECMLSISH